MTTRLASHAIRGDVSGQTRVPPSITDWPGASASASIGIDVDDDLVARARRAGIDPVLQRGLRDQHQRVGLLLCHRRRFRGNVRRLCTTLAC